MLASSLAEALSALKEDYQPKRVTFKDLPPISEAPHIHQFSLDAIPFFPRNQPDFYSLAASAPLSTPQLTPINTSPALSPLTSQLAAVRVELTERTRRLEEALSELVALRSENRNLNELRQSADKEREVALGLLEERAGACEEAERRANAAIERAVTTEKRVLLLSRNQSLDAINAELSELERLARWTELNSKSPQYALQLRSHAETVRELLKRVTEQFQKHFELLDRGTPFSRLPRINSEIPSRPPPAPDPVLYLPTDVEVYLPCANSPGFAQPRYGPQMFPPKSEDVHDRLIRKLSNWHPELTDSQLYSYIIAAQKAASGQSFSGMTMTEIISNVHELIVSGLSSPVS